MHWVALGIIGIGLIVAASRYPKLAFGILAGLIGTVLVVVKFNSDEHERSALLVLAGDVEFSNILFSPGYAGSYNMSGRLINRSIKSGIAEVGLSVTMLDCSLESAGIESDCSELAEVYTRISIEIPPGQTKEFSTNLPFPDRPPKGETRWAYVVDGVIGREY
ncbi:MAG: hypothetical protein CMK60_08585 [Proteobacteria bacterium]|jgi:hypothetical protein|nr:hypothetical protein [Pseudomonadota bacterium]MBP10494.1 hypothetical protein [Acidiferrobacteraceae bacterium]MDP6136380.1 hypothetical protein [Arenicellales bacterium]MDP6392882.1 hypothetical protein [Arenicellales bacterium]HJP11236.1 hypothetical protein [Arenicellales bacterium]|tara:strand:- start:76 stop:564 length:489 start_codon:yes stop_codon:yes gene_type:complete